MNLLSKRDLCELTGRLVLWRAIAILAVVAPNARSDNWPVVRGDIEGTGVAETAIPDALDVLWTYSAGENGGFDATAVVADGIVYVGDNAGTFHAVRQADGKRVWTKTFEDGSFTAGAAISGDRLYVGDLYSKVRCLARVDGQELWSVDVGGEVYAGPTVYEDTLLVTSEAGTLTCLNLADGGQRWRFSIEAPLRCTPTFSAGRVMLSGCDSLLHVINVADGQEIGKVEIDAPTGATAAMRENRVYFGTEGGTFFAIDVPAEADAQPKVAWEYRDPRRGQPIRAAAAASEHLVVFGSQGKAVNGLNPTNGERKWQIATRSRVESSPVIAGERVVAATAAGKLYLLDAASGEVKWDYDAGGSFTASPAVVDGQIILGNGDGKLYCFGSMQGAGQLTTEDTERKK